MIFIYLESFSTLANKYNSIHSDKHNIFSTRTRRQVLFGGKHLKILRLLQTHIMSYGKSIQTLDDNKHFINNLYFF